jgi:hypothetical protein
MNQIYQQQLLHQQQQAEQLRAIKKSQNRNKTDDHDNSHHDTAFKHLTMETNESDFIDNNKKNNVLSHNSLNLKIIDNENNGISPSPSSTINNHSYNNNDTTVNELVNTLGKTSLIDGNNQVNLEGHASQLTTNQIDTSLNNKNDDEDDDENDSKFCNH